MKPYLVSVGVALPGYGLYGHHYFESKRRWKLRSWRRLGISVVVTSYTRVE